MDAMGFFKKFGTETSKLVAEKAGTNYVYFKHIMHNRRRPSPELAMRLVKASGGKLDFESLLLGGNS